MSDEFASEEQLRGFGLPAGAHHYRAYVGRPERYDELAVLQFRVLTDLGLREMHHVLEVDLQELFASVGLTWRALDQYPHPAGVTWFLLRRVGR